MDREIQDMVSKLLRMLEDKGLLPEPDHSDADSDDMETLFEQINCLCVSVEHLEEKLKQVYTHVFTKNSSNENPNDWK